MAEISRLARRVELVEDFVELSGTVEARDKCSGETRGDEDYTGGEKLLVECEANGSAVDEAPAEERVNLENKEGGP